jgi:hypothetical protein
MHLLPHGVDVEMKMEVLALQGLILNHFEAQ